MPEDLDIEFPELERGETLEELVGRFSENEATTGMMVGGSVARGFSDEMSDVELYVYSDDEPLSRSAREQVFEEVLGPGTFEHSLQGPWGEYSFVEDHGFKADIAFRSLQEVSERLDRFFQGEIPKRRPSPNDTAFGHYEEGIASDITGGDIVYDSSGGLTDLRDRLEDYPQDLRERTVERELGAARGLVERRVRKAARREDFPLFDATSARTLRAVYHSLFALNEEYYPGDKWNHEHVRSFERVPEGFEEKIESYRALPEDSPASMREKAGYLDEIVEGLERLARQEGLIAGE